MSSGGGKGEENVGFGRGIQYLLVVVRDHMETSSRPQMKGRAGLPESENENAQE